MTTTISNCSSWCMTMCTEWTRFVEKRLETITRQYQQQQQQKSSQSLENSFVEVKVNRRGFSHCSQSSIKMSFIRNIYSCINITCNALVDRQLAMIMKRMNDVTQTLNGTYYVVRATKIDTPTATHSHSHSHEHTKVNGQFNYTMQENYNSTIQKNRTKHKQCNKSNYRNNNNINSKRQRRKYGIRAYIVHRAHTHRKSFSRYVCVTNARIDGKTSTKIGIYRACCDRILIGNYIRHQC